MVRRSRSPSTESGRWSMCLQRPRALLLRIRATRALHEFRRYRHRVTCERQTFGTSETMSQEKMIMAKMRAIEAAVQVMLKEGVIAAFGLPGAAINPQYAAMR